ncbi:hypothetical protein B0T26DRAFT_696793 [Lasiosphaeria miniovina]|uniref:Uncharacterized protein n=1 Tax=Lasiosphaeria miniovina TaxID=1954250 RepID=A0AA40E8N7_9PEZI|nr:uncharacterized protein B0T26DRAFT_696793 [Lasiosphaeria miniovina]KAK0728091.1 hypothetical protein B0T26DRAFT_696793 [Lasiosphaeria miniovina]
MIITSWGFMRLLPILGPRLGCLTALITYFDSLLLNRSYRAYGRTIISWGFLRLMLVTGLNLLKTRSLLLIPLRRMRMF